MTRRARIGIGITVGLAIASVAFFTFGPGKDLRNLWSHGVIQSVIDDPLADRKYSASRKSNLKAIYVALDLYQESEGHYPAAQGWMDAIKQRLHVNDMTNEEAAKKLVRPNIANLKQDQYGYALNDRVAGKFKGDIKDSSTPLVFESPDLSKNAHGVPTGRKGLLTVTVSGQVKNP